MSGWWLIPVLLAATGVVGVLVGLLVHWWLEARALRPAYLAERAAARATNRGDRLRA